LKTGSESLDIQSSLALSRIPMASTQPYTDYTVTTFSGKGSPSPRLHIPMFDPTQNVSMTPHGY
jgi:hypothetical protein